ncbi:hypothetical protein FNF27_03687 [Cafeteria roenbergensis]|uniref:Uncharacterized protein n=3 Tax=Cafeteria roenbergensis TaxID=33653 RepID=A0A5A8EFP6_CAFRO|nr:hypothetical protein FNF27_03687 [Cafeteria roenbergensis]
MVREAEALGRGPGTPTGGAAQVDIALFQLLASDDAAAAEDSDSSGSAGAGGSKQEEDARDKPLPGTRRRSRSSIFAPAFKRASFLAGLPDRTVKGAAQPASAEAERREGEALLAKLKQRLDADEERRRLRKAREKGPGLLAKGAGPAEAGRGRLLQNRRTRRQSVSLVPEGPSDSSAGRGSAASSEESGYAVRRMRARGPQMLEVMSSSYVSDGGDSRGILSPREQQLGLRVLPADGDSAGDSSLDDMSGEDTEDSADRGMIALGGASANRRRRRRRREQQLRLAAAEASARSRTAGSAAQRPFSQPRPLAGVIAPLQSAPLPVRDSDSALASGISSSGSLPAAHPAMSAPGGSRGLSSAERAAFLDSVMEHEAASGERDLRAAAKRSAAAASSSGMRILIAAAKIEQQRRDGELDVTAGTSETSGPSGIGGSVARVTSRARNTAAPAGRSDSQSGGSEAGRHRAAAAGDSSVVSGTGRSGTGARSVPGSSASRRTASAAAGFGDPFVEALSSEADEDALNVVAAAAPVEPKAVPAELRAGGPLGQRALQQLPQAGATPRSGKGIRDSTPLRSVRPVPVSPSASRSRSHRAGGGLGLGSAKARTPSTPHAPRDGSPRRVQTAGASAAGGPAADADMPVTLAKMAGEVLFKAQSFRDARVGAGVGGVAAVGGAGLQRGHSSMGLGSSRKPGGARGITAPPAGDAGSLFALEEQQSGISSVGDASVDDGLSFASPVAPHDPDGMVASAGPADVPTAEGAAALIGEAMAELQPKEGEAARESQRQRSLRQQCARALRDLSKQPGNRFRILGQGAHSAIVTVLEDTRSASTRLDCAVALANLSALQPRVTQFLVDSATSYGPGWEVALAPGASPDPSAGPLRAHATAHGPAGSRGAAAASNARGEAAPGMRRGASSPRGARPEGGLFGPASGVAATLSSPSGWGASVRAEWHPSQLLDSPKGGLVPAQGVILALGDAVRGDEGAALATPGGPGGHAQDSDPRGGGAWTMRATAALALFNHTVAMESRGRLASEMAAEALADMLRPRSLVQVDTAVRQYVTGAAAAERAANESAATIVYAQAGDQLLHDACAGVSARDVATDAVVVPLALAGLCNMAAMPGPARRAVLSSSAMGVLRSVWFVLPPTLRGAAAVRLVEPLTRVPSAINRLATAGAAVLLVDAVRSAYSLLFDEVVRLLPELVSDDNWNQAALAEAARATHQFKLRDADARPLSSLRRRGPGGFEPHSTGGPAGPSFMSIDANPAAGSLAVREADSAISEQDESGPGDGCGAADSTVMELWRCGAVASLLRFLLLVDPAVPGLGAGQGTSSNAATLLEEEPDAGQSGRVLGDGGAGGSRPARHGSGVGAAGGAAQSSQPADEASQNSSPPQFDGDLDPLLAVGAAALYNATRCPAVLRAITARPAPSAVLPHPRAAVTRPQEESRELQALGRAHTGPGCVEETLRPPARGRVPVLRTGAIGHRHGDAAAAAVRVLRLALDTIQGSSPAKRDAALAETAAACHARADRSPGNLADGSTAPPFLCNATRAASFAVAALRNMTDEATSGSAASRLLVVNTPGLLDQLIRVLRPRDTDPFLLIERGFFGEAAAKSLASGSMGSGRPASPPARPKSSARSRRPSAIRLQGAVSRMFSPSPGSAMLGGRSSRADSERLGARSAGDDGDDDERSLDLDLAAAALRAQATLGQASPAAGMLAPPRESSGFGAARPASRSGPQPGSPGPLLPPLPLVVAADAIAVLANVAADKRSRRLVAEAGAIPCLVPIAAKAPMSSLAVCRAYSLRLLRLRQWDAEFLEDDRQAAMTEAAAVPAAAEGAAQLQTQLHPAQPGLTAAGSQAQLTGRGSSDGTKPAAAAGSSAGAGFAGGRRAASSLSPAARGAAARREAEEGGGLSRTHRKTSGRAAAAAGAGGASGRGQAEFGVLGLDGDISPRLVAEQLRLEALAGRAREQCAVGLTLLATDMAWEAQAEAEEAASVAGEAQGPGAPLHGRGAPPAAPEGRKPRPSLRAAGRLDSAVMRSEEQAAVQFRAGILRALRALAQFGGEGAVIHLHVARALRMLSSAPGVCEELVGEGVIPVVMALAASTRPAVRRECAGTIFNLSVQPDTAEALVGQGAVGTLVALALVRCRDAASQTLCVLSLHNLLAHPGTRWKVLTMPLAAATAVRAAGQTQADAEQKAIAEAAAKALSESADARPESVSPRQSPTRKQPPGAAPVRSAVIWALQRLCLSPFVTVQRACALTMRRLADEEACRGVLVEEGALKAVVKILLRSADPDASETDEAGAGSVGASVAGPSRGSQPRMAGLSAPAGGQAGSSQSRSMPGFSVAAAQSAAMLDLATASDPSQDSQVGALLAGVLGAVSRETGHEETLVREGAVDALVLLASSGSAGQDVEAQARAFAETSGDGAAGLGQLKSACALGLCNLAASPDSVVRRRVIDGGAVDVFVGLGSGSSTVEPARSLSLMGLCHLLWAAGPTTQRAVLNAGAARVFTRLAVDAQTSGQAYAAALCLHACSSSRALVAPMVADGGVTALTALLRRVARTEPAMLLRRGAAARSGVEQGSDSASAGGGDDDGASRPRAGGFVADATEASGRSDAAEVGWGAKEQSLMGDTAALALGAAANLAQSRRGTRAVALSSAGRADVEERRARAVARARMRGMPVGAGLLESVTACLEQGGDGSRDGAAGDGDAVEADSDSVFSARGVLTGLPGAAALAQGTCLAAAVAACETICAALNIFLERTLAEQRRPSSADSASDAESALRGCPEEASVEVLRVAADECAALLLSFSRHDALCNALLRAGGVRAAARLLDCKAASTRARTRAAAAARNLSAHSGARLVMLDLLDAPDARSPRQRRGSAVSASPPSPRLSDGGGSPVGCSRAVSAQSVASADSVFAVCPVDILVRTALGEDEPWSVAARRRAAAAQVGGISSGPSGAKRPAELALPSDCGIAMPSAESASAGRGSLREEDEDAAAAEEDGSLDVFEPFAVAILRGDVVTGLDSPRAGAGRGNGAHAGMGDMAMVSSDGASASGERASPQRSVRHAGAVRPGSSLSAAGSLVAGDGAPLKARGRRLSAFFFAADGGRADGASSATGSGGRVSPRSSAAVDARRPSGWLAGRGATPAAGVSSSASVRSSSRAGRGASGGAPGASASSALPAAAAAESTPERSAEEERAANRLAVQFLRRADAVKALCNLTRDARAHGRLKEAGAAAAFLRVSDDPLCWRELRTACLRGLCELSIEKDDGADVAASGAPEAVPAAIAASAALKQPLADPSGRHNSRSRASDSGTAASGSGPAGGGRAMQQGEDVVAAGAVSALLAMMSNRDEPADAMAEGDADAATPSFGCMPSDAALCHPNSRAASLPHPALFVSASLKLGVDPPAPGASQAVQTSLTDAYKARLTAESERAAEARQAAAVTAASPSLGLGRSSIDQAAGRTGSAGLGGPDGDEPPPVIGSSLASLPHRVVARAARSTGARGTRWSVGFDSESKAAIAAAVAAEAGAAPGHSLVSNGGASGRAEADGRRGPAPGAPRRGSRSTHAGELAAGGRNSIGHRAGTASGGQGAPDGAVPDADGAAMAASGLADFVVEGLITRSPPPVITAALGLASGPPARRESTARPSLPVSRTVPWLVIDSPQEVGAGTLTSLADSEAEAEAAANPAQRVPPHATNPRHHGRGIAADSIVSLPGSAGGGQIPQLLRALGSPEDMDAITRAAGPAAFPPLPATSLSALLQPDAAEASIEDSDDEAAAPDEASLGGGAGEDGGLFSAAALFRRRSSQGAAQTPGGGGGGSGTSPVAGLVSPARHFARPEASSSAAASSRRAAKPARSSVAAGFATTAPALVFDTAPRRLPPHACTDSEGTAFPLVAEPSLARVLVEVNGGSSNVLVGSGAPLR